MNAKYIFMLQEGNAHTYRQIFMDGRKHPVDPSPTWYGHSIGHWEGPTLVVDTIGLNDKFWLDGSGIQHTEQLHLVERCTRTDYSTMKREVTIEDPGAFTRPFTVTYTAKLGTPDSEIFEYICIENNQYGLAQGIQPADKGRSGKVRNAICDLRFVIEASTQVNRRSQITIIDESSRCTGSRGAGRLSWRRRSCRRGSAAPTALVPRPPRPTARFRVFPTARSISTACGPEVARSVTSARRAA